MTSPTPTQPPTDPLGALQGFAGLLARHCELRATPGGVELELHDPLRALADSPAFAEVLQAVRAQTGSEVHVVFGPAESAPAVAAARQAVSDTARVLDAFAADATVNGLIREFGAVIDLDSLITATNVNRSGGD